MLLLVLQLAASQPSPTAGLTPADSLRLRARVDSATRAFQRQWTDAWAESQENHPFLSSHEYVRDGDEREMAVHCHWDSVSRWLHQHLIRGTATAHATCPRFLPPDVTNVEDERRRIDNGLDRRYRPTIDAHRRRLLAFLDSAAGQLPRDIYLAGQRVRFGLAAGDLEDAADAAASCSYDVVQCGLLEGLILYQLGDIPRADSTFAAAASLMSPDRRCEWNDVRILLDAEARQRYELMSCAARAAYEARLWWLADPLWLEPGNERRAEHFARQVAVGLLAPMGDDGRQHFTPGMGGESVVQSLVRYGWPSQMFWAGPRTDGSHDEWLRAHGAVTARPYVVREYTRAGRLHVVPPPSIVEDPFATPHDGWQLTAPDDDWWPQEFYARDRSAIVGLPAGQMVMLRRRDSTRLIWGGELDSAARGESIDPRRQVVVFDSRAVGEVRVVGSFPLRAGGSKAIVDAPFARGTTLLGIEVPGDSTHAAARSRYGVEIEPPLSASGAIAFPALSQPLLFDAPADASQSVETEQAVEHMYTSTTLRNAGRIGVYWESYGFRPTDTLDLAVGVTREDRPNVLMRAFRALGIGQSGGNDVAIRWREIPGNSRAIHRLEGDVPIQLRSIVVEVSRLPRGSYILQLALNRPGHAPVTSQRRFELR